MPSVLFNPGALKFYFPRFPSGASDFAYSVAAPVPTTAQVTASIQGPNSAQFGSLLLTAYRRTIAPPPPPGPFPAVAASSRSPRKPAVRPALGSNWVYVQTGQSNGTTPLLVEAQGMLEVDVTCTAPPQVNASQNRFAAEVVLSGTTWSQARIPLVLNVLEGDSCILLAGEATSVQLIAGEAGIGFTWSYRFVSGFSPVLDEDYPVTVTLNPGEGDVAPGVYLSPRRLTLTFDNAAEGQSQNALQANGTIGAYFYAAAASNQFFQIPQEAFVANSAEAGLCTSPGNIIGGASVEYSILPSPIPPLPEPG